MMVRVGFMIPGRCEVAQFSTGGRHERLPAQRHIGAAYERFWQVDTKAPATPSVSGRSRSVHCRGRGPGGRRRKQEGGDEVRDPCGAAGLVHPVRLMTVKAARSARDAIDSGISLRNGNALTNQARNRVTQCPASSSPASTSRRSQSDESKL
jgi:hypothetical protein